MANLANYLLQICKDSAGLCLNLFLIIWLTFLSFTMRVMYERNQLFTSKYTNRFKQL